MDYKTKLDRAIINLVADYESGIQGGKITYLDEKQYFKLIAYYETECLYEKALDVLEKALLQFQFRSEFYIAKARLLLNIDQLDQAGDQFKMLVARLEASPDVKTIEMLRDMQSDAEKTEDLIQIAKETYNALAANYNEFTRQFPSILVAMLFLFRKLPYVHSD